MVLRDRVELSSRDYKSRALTTELAEYGASDRSRTCNLCITGALRYQLRHRSRWRRGRDSNSRNPFGFGGLAIHCTQPLCDLSMAGLVGFEPTNIGFKVLHLTAWRQPNISLPNLYILYSKFKKISKFSSLFFQNYCLNHCKYNNNKGSYPYGRKNPPPGPIYYLT